MKKHKQVAQAMETRTLIIRQYGYIGICYPMHMHTIEILF